MLGSIVLPIIGVVIVVILGGIGAYFFVRASKGKLELHLPKTGFGSGESITGTVTLTTKKSLEARRFVVALICHEEVESRDNSQDGKRTERREVYRSDFALLDGETLPAGLNQSYPFELLAPGKGEVDGGGSTNLGLQIEIGALSLGSQRRRLQWKVEARVDLPGVDLAKSTSVRVNLS